MIKIKYLKVAEAKTPKKAHNDDMCFDVYATSEEEIAPNVWSYGTGLKFEINRDGNLMDLDLCIDLRPRSSIYKTGMVLSNSIGTIDEGYRGEVKAVFYHIKPDMPRYKVGDKIGQIKVTVGVPVEFEQVNRLTDTIRGAGGYGSTGR